MSKTLVIVVACIYGYVAFEQLCKGNKPGFIVWGSYALANMGLYWNTR